MRPSTALLPVVVVNLLSLIGFATFASNPDYLKMFPWAEPLFEISYPLFSRLQILLATGTLVVILTKFCSTSWVRPFLALAITSLTSELIGTNFGIPFGAYGYSALLGFKILDKVPALIPLSWFYMSLASYDLVRQHFSNPKFNFTRVTLSAIVLLVWDLVLDPAMSHLTPFWIWENPGGFFGMPTSNLVGWFITGFVLMVWLEFFRAYQWLTLLPENFMKLFYVANLMLPLGMCLISRLWIPVVLSVGALLPFLLPPHRINQIVIKAKGSLA